MTHIIENYLSYRINLSYYHTILYQLYLTLSKFVFITYIRNIFFYVKLVNFSEHEGNEVLIEQTEDDRLRWTWCLIFIFLVPECISVLNALWDYLFKKKPRMPKKRNILFMIVIDTLHTIGLVLLTFIILPEIGAVQGAGIFCCLCFIPGLLSKFVIV